MAEMADKPDSVNVAAVLVNETLDEIQEEAQEVINVHVNANANGSLIADTSTSHLFAVFGTLAEALDLVKSFFTDEYLCCSKAQFLDKIREQVAGDTEVLRYARDLLFTITKRRKKMYQASSLVERKTGDGLQDKLLKDIFEIYSFGEGAKDSLPKSMLKDHVPVTSEITQDLLNSHQAELLLTFENAKAEFISVVENMKSELVSDVLEAHKKEFDSIKKDVGRSPPSVAAIKVPQITTAVSVRNGSSQTSHREEISSIRKAEARVGDSQSKTKQNQNGRQGKAKSHKKKNNVNDNDRREYAKETDSVKSHTSSTAESKRILFAGDSLFHGLVERRLNVDDMKAVKMAKSGDTFEGVCQRVLDFIKNQNDVEAVVILAGTNNLSKKNCTPEDLLEIVLKSVKDLTKNFSGKVFICKVPPRIDLYNVDSKINRFNDLLSISELSNHKSVILVETIGREVRYFNIFNGHCDGLHLNRKVGCKALSGITLKTIYANLRPHCKKSKSNRPKHKPH